jgi:hypothetical protein
MVSGSKVVKVVMYQPNPTADLLKNEVVENEQFIYMIAHHVKAVAT